MEDSLAEMELCMVALDNTENQEIKAFAQSMLDEHGKRACRGRRPLVFHVRAGDARAG